METNGDILVATGLCKSFGTGSGRVDVLQGLDLTVRRGEYVAVMGPSGCGKSTLLHVVGLMTPPDAGRIVLDGAPAAGSERTRTALRGRHIGFVFQRFNLLSVLSARDNIRVSLQVRGIDVDGQAEQLLDAMGVAHVARRKPGQMSIGEQQRVAVARALAHSPALLLADEPTGNLDSHNADALLDLFDDIHQRENQTIVMITHSPDAAARTDRTVQMRDGKLTDQHS
jgi:ABC-type lipoprotein export system ATPase subunit